MISVEDHFGRLAALLRMESEAEARQTLERVRRLSPAEAERGGDCLIDLVVRDEDPGLGGRVVVALGKRRAAALPWTRLQTGAPVLLSLQDRASDPGRRGVVCERDESLIHVALNESPDADDGTLFRLSPTRFRLCCQERHLPWLLDSAEGLDVAIAEETAEVAGLALQGPTSYAVLRDAGFAGVEKLKVFDLPVSCCAADAARTLRVCGMETDE